MKRYQCIKNIRHELFEFKPGFIYNFKENPGGNFYGYTTIVGRIIWLKSEQIREHFQELLDLHVDEQIDYTDHHVDHDTVEYRRFIESAGFSRGCAWAVAGFGTAIVIIYLVNTWRS